MAKVSVTREEVLAAMRRTPYMQYRHAADVIEEGDKNHPEYKIAEADYKSIYAQLRRDKLMEINKTKRDFFMTYLYPSVKDLLDIFGITTDYLGYDSVTKKMVVKKGDANNQLTFLNSGNEIIVCVLENIVIPMLEAKGIKGLKLRTRNITGGARNDIFDFSNVSFEKPEE